jgi:hypothetical protein
MRGFWAATVFVTLTAVWPAWAQSSETPAVDGHRLTRIELGGGLAGTAVPGGTSLPSFEARVNISPRIAIDVVTDFETGRYIRGVEGMYVLQVRQAVGDSRGMVTPFVTYGTVGGFQYQHVSGFQYTLATGDRVIYPGSSHVHLSSPFALVGGGGARFGLAHHLSLEAGAQVVGGPGFAGLLFNAGVMVPIGRGR